MVLLGRFAATGCSVLYKRMLSGRRSEVETSFHYSDSRFFIGWIRTDDRNAVVYMVLKRQNEEEENVKGREMGRGCFSLRERRQGWIPG